MNKEEQQIYQIIQTRLGSAIEKEFDVDYYSASNNTRFNIEDLNEFCCKAAGHPLYVYTWARPITEEEYYATHEYIPMTLDELDPVPYSTKEHFLNDPYSNSQNKSLLQMLDFCLNREQYNYYTWLDTNLLDKIYSDTVNLFDRTVNDVLDEFNKLVDKINLSLPAKAKPYIPFINDDGYARILYFMDSGVIYTYPLGDLGNIHDREYDSEGNFYLTGMNDRQSYYNRELVKARGHVRSVIHDFINNQHLYELNEENGKVHYSRSIAFIKEKIKLDSIPNNIKGKVLTEKVDYYYGLVEPDNKKGRYHVTKKEIKDIIKDCSN